MISKDPSFIEISADQIARFDLVVYWTINWIDQNVCWPENVPHDETTHLANKLFVNPLDGTPSTTLTKSTIKGQWLWLSW